MVTILGTHFTGATLVRFKDITAAFAINSDTQITATVPAGASTGPIKVTNPSGTDASSTNFKVTGAKPTITSFSPTSGPVGTTVVVFGTNFVGATKVEFRFRNASFTVNSPTQITATVPSGASTGPIRVTNASGTGTSRADFRVTSSRPRITSLFPTSGHVGTTVTVTGANFSGTTEVRFGNRAAAFTVNSPSQISATVPAGATTGRVKVTNASGTGESSAAFVVIHARRVTLRLHGSLVAAGVVSVVDGFVACRQGLTVQIQRRVFGFWHTIARKLTAGDGFFSVRIPARTGTYRARLLRKTMPSGDVCGRARSGLKMHR